MLQPGEHLLNRYEIGALIGRGGMGSIYRGWDRNLQIACAVKLNETVAAGANAQFMREAQMLAALHHPNLPRVYDYFDLPGRGQCLVMNFVEGSDLQTQIEQHGALPQTEALAIALQICDALTYLHGRPQPIIHRDIKPANIRITPDGNAVLVDFGIARALTAGSVTTQGARGVTPGYSPPEQYGRGQTSPRSDVYALGATLWALLSGIAPPASTDRLAGNPLPPPTGASGALNGILARALALNPADRFADGADFRTALHALHATPARGVTPPVGGGLPVRPLLIGAAVLLLFVLAGFAGSRLLGGSPTPEPRSVVVFATANTQDATATIEETIPASTTVESATATAQPAAGMPVVDKTDTPEPTVTSTMTPSPTATPTDSPTATSRPPASARDVLTARYGATSSDWRLTTDSAEDYVPALSPDGQTLVYGADGSGTWQIYTLDLITGATRQLTASRSDHYHPRFSADGSRIVYASEQTGTWEIFTMRPDGSDQRQITSNDFTDWRPSFMPDGRIVYMSVRNQQWGIYISDADGRNERQLRDTGSSSPSPAVAPDGSQIAFMEVADGNYEIFVMYADGSGARRLTNNRMRDAEPTFAADGRWVLYESQLSGGYEIMGVSIDGGTPRQLTTGGGNQIPSVSPDGTVLFYQSSRNGDYDLYARPFAP